MRNIDPCVKEEKIDDQDNSHVHENVEMEANGPPQVQHEETTNQNPNVEPMKQEVKEEISANEEQRIDPLSWDQTPVFTCYICNFVFPRETDLIMHYHYFHMYMC